MMTALMETKIDPRIEYRPSPSDPMHFIPLVNKMGEFALLHKRDLRIDLSYQRSLNERVVTRIANNWNWAACGCLLVSLRTDGAGWFIFDGGHRWSAARLLSEIGELPCLVFEMASVTAEAIAFLSVNTERKTIGPMASYKAELMTGSPRALLVDELARMAGRTVGVPSDKTHISCVSAMQRYAAVDKDALRRVWPLITELCQDGPMPSLIIQALWATERRMPYGQSLTDDRWRARLLRAGMLNLERSVRGTIALEGSRTERSVSHGVQTTVNHGLKAGKLRLRERFGRGE
jgi:hypothetical protein